MTPGARMGMSSDFLLAFAALPKGQQKSVRALISKFNADSQSVGINYETIKTARDPKMRSVRIDQAYRAIVLKPDAGDVHLLLWADKHDEAYAWAARHECSINPETGAIQIYEPDPEASSIQPVQASSAGTETGAPGVFSQLKDRELTRLGVPPAMLNEVRALEGEVALDLMQKRLPIEAYEALFLYMAGEPYENLVLARETDQGPVDEEDYQAALQRVETKARFVVVEDDAELEAMLNAPLERWRVFLHPSQRRLVERNWNGAVRVLGGAGTGKTVVAMHRARWLARNAADEARILFTTFTRNLALDIEHNLKTICTPEELGRIEVTNLDRWVTRFLHGQEYDFRIVYGRDKEAWERALELAAPSLGLADEFYNDEWEQVVQARGVLTDDDYRRVPRTGRGTRLNRAGRIKVWKVFEEYRTQLAERGLKEVDDAYRDAAALLESGKKSLGYTSVIVDEAQDMGAQSYHLLRRIVAEGVNDMFIVGDGHQRIYGRNKVVLGRCGINVRGRSRKLKLNYRTTEETRRWAAALLEGREIDDLDGGIDNNRAFKSVTHGPQPVLRSFDSFDKQADYLAEVLTEKLNGGIPARNISVLARTGRERDRLADALQARTFKTHVLAQDSVDTSVDDGIRLSTMHRIKGLEFDIVVIGSVNAGLVPLPYALDAKGDSIERDSAETEERALIYVSATRAKRELYILSYGTPSPFLKGI